MMVWLRSTEAWQRLIVRGLKNPKTWVFYPMIIGSLVMFVQIAYLDYQPILDLDQMDKHTGILVDVYTTGRAQKPWIALRQGDQTFAYVIYVTQMPELEKLIGQKITIWSQPTLMIVKLGYDNYVRQIKVGDQLIMNYEKDYRPHMEALRTGKIQNYGEAFYVLPSIMLLIGLTALWKMNAKPYEPPQEKE